MNGLLTTMVTILTGQRFHLNVRTTLLIAIASLLSCFTELSAQATTTYALGVKGGTNLSHLVEKVAINKLLLSYVAGISLEQQFSPRVSLSYELLYSRQGDMEHFINTNDRLRTRYNYITLPIELRYRLKRYPIYIIPGFQAGYLVNKQVDLLPSHGITTQNNDQEKKVDLGLSAGWAIVLASISLDMPNITRAFKPFSNHFLFTIRQRERLSLKQP